MRSIDYVNKLPPIRLIEQTNFASADLNICHEVA